MILIFSIFLISTMVQVQGKVISSPALEESVQDQIGGGNKEAIEEKNKIESGQSVINADAAAGDETNDKDMGKVSERKSIFEF